MIRFAIAFTALVFWASTAVAGADDAFGRTLMARIKAEGFRIESVKTTFLRRIQIDSKNSRKRRQTVYNPVTAVVLRDAIFDLEDKGVLAHVHEILGVDLRSFRSGRGGKDNASGHDVVGKGKAPKKERLEGGKGKPGGGKVGRDASSGVRSGDKKPN